MTHDFDAAREDMSNTNRNADISMDRKSIDAIVFALRFTKAALSGEVSSGMYREGAGKQGYRKPLHQGMRPASSQYDEAERLRNAFKAMCAELAKEVGNG